MRSYFKAQIQRRFYSSRQSCRSSSPTNYSIVLQVLILDVSSIAVEFFILLTYGQLAGRTLSAVKNPRFEKLSNRIAGSLLIGAGLGLARIKTHFLKQIAALVRIGFIPAREPLDCRPIRRRCSLI